MNWFRFWKALAANKFHDDIGLAFFLAEGIYLYDVRVVQLGDGLGFPFESLYEFLVVTK